jgi:sugar fermentation stimulation protein A
MHFGSTLLPGRFLRRYKRFFADVRLDDATIVTAHCANSGSMKSCYELDGRVWLSHEDHPKRKLKYTWQLAEVGRVRICVHPLLANRLTREAVEAGVVAELRGYDDIAAEPIIDRHTRFDLLLTRGSQRCFVEVKSATLSLGGGRIAFPDSVSLRGAKHLRELAKQVARGHRAVLLFAANRTDAKSVEPADGIDAEYGRTLRWAVAAGVEVLAYRAAISVKRIELKTPIPVVLDPVPVVATNQTQAKPSKCSDRR